MSLDIQNIEKLDATKIGYFRFKKFDEATYLITNDLGRFCFLKNSEFENLLSAKIEEGEKKEELLEKKFLIDENYEDDMAAKYEERNHFIGSGPSLHMVVTTLRCNHKCKYCHAAVAPMAATEFDMTKETAKRVVDTIFYTNSPFLTIEFQGGESLVNREIVEYIVDYAAPKAFHLQKELTFSLVSNLTLMTEAKLTRLLDHGVDICTSLDGDEIAHNNNRTGYDGNSFDQVTYWMKRLTAEKQKRKLGKANALLTVTKETLPRYKEIIDTYIGLGLNGIFLRWLNPYGFAAADMKALAYSDAEWIGFFKDSLDYIIEINKKGTFFKEIITTVFLQKIFSDKDPAFMDIRSPSGIGIGGVAYNYDGKVYASDESRMLGRMGIQDFFVTDLGDDPGVNYSNMMEAEVTNIAVQSSTLDGLPGYNDHVYKPYLGVDIIHNFKTTGNLYVPFVKDSKINLQIAILDHVFEKMRDPEVMEIFQGWMKR